MQRISTLLICCAILCAAIVSPAAAQDPLQLENTLLRAEYEMARKGQIYLVLNLEAKEFAVRASGITLATIPIQEIRVWGPLPEPGLHLVTEKDRVPPREKIQIPPAGSSGEPVKPPAAEAGKTQPEKPAEKKFDLQATEVTDMPTSYSLWLEGGGLIAIKSLPVASDWKSKLALSFEKTWWKVSRALNSNLNHYRKKTYTELLLIMTPHDAQRLYWTLPLGTAILMPAPPQS